MAAIFTGTMVAREPSKVGSTALLWTRFQSDRREIGVLMDSRFGTDRQLQFWER